MKINPKVQIALIVLLSVIGVAALFSVYRYTSLFFYSVAGPSSFYLLSGLAGGSAVLLFVIATTRSLLKKKPISKEAYIISIAFSIVGLLALASFGYGLLKDLLGVYCAGFFGSQSSCTLSPLLFLLVFVLNPASLGLAGVASVYGLITLRTSSRHTP